MVKAVVGANWGDEGKGKITDMLAEKADIIVRFQGGANAGHTIVNNYGKFALHTLPSGVFYNHTTSVIGNGVALNIPILMKEIKSITDRNVPMPKILVSDRAQMVMPYHILFDQYEEERLGGKSFGSTKSGIAPFYSDKYAKIGFQVSELFDDELLEEKVQRVSEMKNVILEHLYHKPLIDPAELLNTLHEYRDMIAPFVCDVSAFLDKALKEGKTILLEGQLGTMKDPDHGIYPMVTSSSTLAAYGAIGAGISPYEIKQIVTVSKAYSSAVGAGAFVSEIFGDEADELRRRGGDGGEFGATTGRPRRMGWFDCVATKYGCRLQGATDVAFTVLDALGYLEEIPVCVGYEIDGEVEFDDELLEEKVQRVSEMKNVILEHLYHKPLIDPAELLNTLHEYRDMIAPFVCDVSAFLDKALKEGKTILLEGQLGTMKDPDHGIYPMVTSSSTLAAYGAIGAGIPPYEIKQIVTVSKAYSSAVGAGAFVSEIFGDEADELRRRGGDGGEFGATTGRPRRMGWFDCVATKYGCRLQGATDVAFTVLDALGYLEEIPVCVGYEIDGEVTTDFPVTYKLEKAKPVLKKLPGWNCDIRGIRKFEDLPENCRKYVEFIEEQIGFPITMVSNGPGREDIIYRESPLKK